MPSSIIRQPKSTGTLSVNREVINTDKQLTSADARYQSLFPIEDNLSVILPNPPSPEDYFIIKNISTAFQLGVKESTDSEPIIFLEPRGVIYGARLIKLLHDGVEWTEV